MYDELFSLGEENKTVLFMGIHVLTMEDAKTFIKCLVDRDGPFQNCYTKKDDGTIRIDDWIVLSDNLYWCNRHQKFSEFTLHNIKLVTRCCYEK